MQFICVGQIAKPQGLRGELFFYATAGEAGWLEKGLQLRVGKNPADAKVFELERFKAHKTGFIIKLKGCEDRNQSEALAKDQVYIDSQNFVSEPGERIFLRELLGFKVTDQARDLGPITDFSSNGPQDLLVVGKNLIPFVSDFLKEIDYQNKVVSMTLPEGLCE
jgi:16S rRNA processing protein RimM